MVFSQNTDVGNCGQWRNGDMKRSRLSLVYCFKALARVEEDRKNTSKRIMVIEAFSRRILERRTLPHKDQFHTVSWQFLKCN